MSYQVLARKWRPKTFSELVGQEHVMQALTNALEQQRLHHAYLFTGTRGVGKTTIARILSKCLNCDLGVTATPCGECGSCVEINEGRFVDLIEVDAASRTKVEDTRELLDNVQYAPSRGRYKVYLIDEVHMLSSHSFNALLKTLEEPPPHVKFLLATTDPQKLPITILSRCLQFSLKAMSPERIVGHLKTVLTAEKVPFEDQALLALGRAADGSMRDALSLTDQAVAFGDGQITEVQVRTMIGGIDRNLVYRLMDALVTNDTGVLLEEVASLAELAPDWSAVLADLISILHRVAVHQAMAEGLDDGLGDFEKLEAYAGSLAAEQVQLYYQTALKGRADLSLSPDKRSGLEMTLLRMLLFRPEGITASQPKVSSGGAQQARQEARAAVKKPLASKQSAPAAAEASQSVLITPEHTKAPQLSEALTTAPEPVASPTVDVAAVEVAQASPVGSTQASSSPDPIETADVTSTIADLPSAPQIPREPQPSSPAAEETRSKPERELDQYWAQMVSQLEISGIALNLAKHAALVSQTQECWTLAVSPQHKAMLNPGYQQKVEQAIHTYSQQNAKIEWLVEQVENQTPENLRQQKIANRLAQAQQSIDQDPLLQELIQTFDGQLDRQSIKPID